MTCFCCYKADGLFVYHKHYKRPVMSPLPMAWLCVISVSDIFWHFEDNIMTKTCIVLTVRNYYGQNMSVLI